MSDNLTKQLLDLKHQIEADKEKKARLEGKLASLMERLKKEFGCDSAQEAEAKLEKLRGEIEQLGTSIQEKIGDIRREYAARA